MRNSSDWSSNKELLTLDSSFTLVQTIYQLEIIQLTPLLERLSSPLSTELRKEVFLTVLMTDYVGQVSNPVNQERSQVSAWSIIRAALILSLK